MGQMEGVWKGLDASVEKLLPSDLEVESSGSTTFDPISWSPDMGVGRPPRPAMIRLGS